MERTGYVNILYASETTCNSVCTSAIQTHARSTVVKQLITVTSNACQKITAKCNMVRMSHRRRK